MKESTLVFDIETVRPVRMKGEAEWPGIEYASSWEDHAGMGIACIGVFDFFERRFRVFGAETLREFRGLMRERQCVVSFNGHHFDNLILSANGVHVDSATSLDLMELFPKRVRLEKVCEANGVPYTKGMPGKEAPIRWQQGQYARVIDYCLSDVWATAALYSIYRKTGSLVDPISGNKMRVPKPQPA